MALRRYPGPYTGIVLLPLLQVLTTGTAFTQPAKPRPTFEVVSIKLSSSDAPNNSFGCRGGPGSASPGQITCNRWRPTMMVTTAYDVSPAVVVYPKSVDAMPEYQLVAKVPAGSTKEDVGLMWQSLLEDRFKLKVHREAKEVPAYELILAKGGFKGKEWAARTPDDPAEVPAELGKPLKLDKEGFPMIPVGQTITFMRGDGARFAAPAGTIARVARMLEGQLAVSGGAMRPVVDSTGLTGKYDLKLAWSPAADVGQATNDGGLTLLEALESQLGLKVRQGKAKVEMLVVDHMENAPTDN